MNDNERLSMSKKELCNLYKISASTLQRVYKNLPERFKKKRIFSGSDLKDLKNAIETR
jgi:DNA-binding transcriptional MocR family regulator